MNRVVFGSFGFVVLSMCLVLTIPRLTQAKIKSGAKFPVVSLSALKSGDSAIDLAQYKGKVVVVDFWASWCGPCSVELPDLGELYKKNKDKGLVVIAVNLDEKRADADAFLKKNPVDLPLAFDGEKQVLAKQLELDTMPTSFVIDKSGVIALRHEGYSKKDAAKIEGTVLKLLGGK